MNQPQAGFHPQGGLENAEMSRSFGVTMQQLLFGKVVNRNVSNNTVDIALDSGGTLQSVPLMVPFASTTSGVVHIPDFTLTNPINDSTGVYDVPGPSGNDVYVAVGLYGGSSRNPVVIGMLVNPQSPGCQMTMSTPGIYVWRHNNGVYTVTLDATEEIPLHYETTFPDGTTVIYGDTTKHNMSSENSNWDITPISPIYITIKHSSGASIQITPTGSINITPTSGNTLSIGASTQHPVAIADTLTTWLNSHVHTVTISDTNYDTSAPNTPVEQSDISATQLTSD